MILSHSTKCVPIHGTLLNKSYSLHRKTDNLRDPPLESQRDATRFAFSLEDVAEWVEVWCGRQKKHPVSHLDRPSIVLRPSAAEERGRGGIPIKNNISSRSTTHTQKTALELCAGVSLASDSSAQSASAQH